MKTSAVLKITAQVRERNSDKIFALCGESFFRHWQRATLRTYANLTYAEIAAVADVSVSSVGNSLGVIAKTMAKATAGVKSPDTDLFRFLENDFTRFAQKLPSSDFNRDDLRNIEKSAKLFAEVRETAKTEQKQRRVDRLIDGCLAKYGSADSGIPVPG